MLQQLVVRVLVLLRVLVLVRVLVRWRWLRIQLTTGTAGTA
ncbi:MULTISPECIES: hypothetical protein [unclassified Streptomyces]|nr:MULTISPECIES: hypothetical protein [unclassified Streptomyces]WUC65752.1 hypothetical protein OG861_16745 [Streptomyces sp. NBC_00539]